MCHTWGLAPSPDELQGGQGQGHQRAPLHVAHLIFDKMKERMQNMANQVRI